jgi:N-acetylmuramoyl-L-alanine amidase
MAEGIEMIDLAGKTHIVIHHSLTKDSGTVSWNAIRRFHVEQQRWNAIGYHFGVERVQDSSDAEAVEILMGRMLHETAAAVKEQTMNTRGVHVCVIGNFDEQVPLPAVWNRTVELTAFLAELLRIPTTNVQPHTLYAPYKSCPGRNWSMERFRVDVDRKRKAL